MASATPTLSLTNLTHPNLSPDFEVGDTYQISITGPPNQPVTMVQTANGSTSTQSFGSTDSYGHAVVTYVEQTGNIGSYTQVWSVGSTQVTPAVSFLVGALGTGSVSTTDLGQTPDGHIEGVSTISITNGTVNTYSVTELDYSAQAYYDAYTVAGIYDEGKLVTSGQSNISAGAAGGTLSAPAKAWDDYTLQTDHYAVAFLVYGSYYENPFYYAPAPNDDGSTGDVIFDPGSGAFYIAAASIYVGSTIADQISVPQDGSVPLVADTAYNSFLQTAPQPLPSDVLFKVDAWGRVIQKAAPLLFIAESAWQAQAQKSTGNSQAVSPHPLPYLLEVYDDCHSASGLARRDRTYTVKDTNGNHWLKSNPLTVWEDFIYISGTGGMPPPNNPSNHNAGGWSTSNGEIDYNGHMLYAYGQQVAQPEVDFWQQYWATGFNASTIPGLPTLPSYTGATLPGIGPSIPLMIKDYRSATKKGFFGTQGVALRSDYVGINGDTGPSEVCPN